MLFEKTTNKGFVSTREIYFFTVDYQHPIIDNSWFEIKAVGGIKYKRGQKE